MKPSLDAIAAFEKIIKSYRWTHDKDPSMIQMFTSDRKNFRKVLSLYRNGKWEEARKHAARMDTAAREFIPQKIWDDIQSA